MPLSLGAGEAAQPQPEHPFTFSKWLIEGGRKDRSGAPFITAHFTLTNHSSEAVRNIRLVIEYRTEDETDKKTPEVRIALLQPGKSQEQSIKQNFVPAFDEYRIHVRYNRGGKEIVAVYSGDTPKDTPALFSDALLKDTAKVKLYGTHLVLWRTGWATGIEITAKNIGAQKAVEPRIEVEFVKTYKNNEVRVTHTEKLLLDKEIAPGRKIKKSLRFGKNISTKTYDTFRVKVVHQELPGEVRLAGAPFAGVKDLEAARWEFVRAENGKDLTVRGKLRNGLSESVSGVVMTLEFIRNPAKGKSTKKPPTSSKPPKGTAEKAGEPMSVAKVKVTLDGVLKAGAERAFEATVKDCGAFDYIQQAFEWGDGDKPVAAVSISLGKGGLPAGMKGGDRIEFAFPNVANDGDKDDVKIIGFARNGTKSDVGGIQLTFTFKLKNGGEKVASIALDGKLAAGQLVPLNLEIPGIGAIKDFSYATVFQKKKIIRLPPRDNKATND